MPLKNIKERRAYSRIQYRKNRNRKLLYSKAYNLSPIGKLSKYRTRAKKNGKCFELDFEYFNSLLVQDCHYCGAKKANCIDRIDSKIGYKKDNVLPCCPICNVMKMGLSYYSFIKHIESIHEYLSKDLIKE